jgi:MinD-like ATPase involved in chromosome partitioning or flagellar assembly
MDINELQSQLEALLPNAQEIKLRPSAIPGAIDIWVIDATARQVLWSEEASELGLGLDSPIYGARYIFQTPQDASASGVKFTAGFARNLRSWAARTAVARRAPTEADENESTSPQVTVFYSFKGGVGRSTALAQAALGLASRGRRVLMIDADFEAPGLQHTFKVAKQVSNERSLIAVLNRIASGVKYGQHPEIDIRDYIVPADSTGQIYLMPAGVVDASYVEGLDSLDIPSWSALPINPASELLRRIVDSDVGFDAILIDARTGLSDANAPFLLDEVRQYVVCFYPSEQTAAGTELVVRTLIGSASGSPRLRFVASPLPRGTGELIDSTMLNRALAWAYEWQYGDAAEGQIELAAIPYDISIARADEVIRDRGVASAYDPIVEWLDPIDIDPPDIVPAAQTTLMRSELRFTDGTGEGAADDIGELFVRTRDTETAEDQRTILVLGRKGTGKTTIFLHLLASGSAVAVTEPESVAESAWRPVGDTWKAIAETPDGLRMAWPILTAMRLVEAGQIRAGVLPEVDDWLREARSVGASTLARIVRDFASTPDASLRALDLLDRTNHSLSVGRRLIFDGLDTMFGLSRGDQDIRNEAILGLLTWVVERESAASNLIFTVFLRTDIWDSLSFANQSHLYGRQLVLSWQPSDYLKTALKQAVRSSSTFSAMVEVGPDDVDTMSDESVIEAWRELCGTRVRGAGTSFTDRWVWSRLQDGNQDHSPRYLIQLCASLLEKAKSRPSDDEGPPLRGRDFGSALEQNVSEQAWRAAREEYPTEEMAQVEEVFRRLTLTPFSTDDWDRAGGSLGLRDAAVTYGILAPHPREEGRWVVPELYRYALSVARRGPA